MTTGQSPQRTMQLASRVWIASAQAAAAVRGAILVWKNRRAVAELLSLDDHMLRDIGVTRYDIASALSEPLFRDASWRLAERALDTRRCRRAVVREALDLLDEGRMADAESPAPRNRAA